MANKGMEYRYKHAKHIHENKQELGLRLVGPASVYWVK